MVLFNRVIQIATRSDDESGRPHVFFLQLCHRFMQSRSIFSRALLGDIFVPFSVREEDDHLNTDV